MMEYVVEIDESADPGGERNAGPGSGPGKGAALREADPRPRAIVGGVDYAVGGWGEYEVDRRRARWEAVKTGGGGASAGGADRPAARYPGRTYVSADDTVRSIVAGSRAVLGGGSAGLERQTTPLQRAALHLADTLGRLEDRLCDPDDDGVWECEPATALRRLGARRNKAAAKAAVYLTVPPLTSADLRAFARDPAQESDPEAMYDLGEDVISMTAAVGVVLAPLPQLVDRGSLPPLPSRVVPVTDDEAVLRLEAASVPYVASLEGIQAALASRLDAAATAIGAALDAK
jgi:hypothetical protein